MGCPLNPQPFNWDVVIVGFWNRAILTPNGIAKRLFKLPEGSGIEVLVPVNSLEPSQVKHNGIFVRVEKSQLIIGTDKPSYEELIKVMKTGCNALQDLPETPVFAAGFNVRFKIDDYPEFEEITQSSIDTQISDAGYEIVSRGVTRKIRRQGGILNLRVRKDEKDEIITELNFHRDSNNITDLINWLSISEIDLRIEVTQILGTVSLRFEEINDE